MDIETTFVRADLKMRARQAMRGNWGLLIPVILIMYSLSIVYAFTPDGSVSESIVALLDLVFTGAFVYAGCTVFLNLTYRRPTSLSEFFAAFSEIGSSLALWGLMLCKIFLWSLLFVIPGVIKALAYSQSFYIKAENPKMSASEALALSEKMTYGYKMDIFVLYLSFIGWDLLCGITFGLAGLYVAPYFHLTMTQLYLYLKESYRANTAFEYFAAEQPTDREHENIAEPNAQTAPESAQISEDDDEYSEETSI